MAKVEYSNIKGKKMADGEFKTWKEIKIEKIKKKAPVKKASKPVEKVES